MPYQMNRDLLSRKLPDDIRDRLPADAERFYWIAFNSAMQWYGEESKAHKIAWSAVRSQAASLNSMMN